MFSAIRTIYHGDSHAKPIFDPPYTPEEAQLLDHLHRAMGETAAKQLEWEIFAFTTHHEEDAFRQGVRLGLRLAQELAEDGQSS